MALSQDAGAPIKDVANSTKDPLASDDYLRGPENAAKNASDQVFNRPERSTAREQIQQTAQSAGNAASDAYQRAPDLGVGSTVNNLYQRAPDLGVGAAVGSALGAAGLGEGTSAAAANSQGNEVQKATGSSIREGGSSARDTTAASAKNGAGESAGDRQDGDDPKRFGPSDKSRVGKPQQEIGTEYGIPTAAGAGTTVSPDDSNKEAQSRAESKGNSKQAAVPEDFENKACPTPHAGSQQHHGTKTPPYRRARDVNNEKAAAAAAASSSSSPSSKRNSSAHGHEKKSSSSDAPQSPALSEASSGGKRRSLGGKIKDQIKGEATIWKGTLKGDDDIVAHGLDIKHGEY